MTVTISVFIMLTAAFLAALSQMLLKREAMRPHASFIKSYLNVCVILAYTILTLTMLMNIVAYTGIEYKYGAVINATSYTFALIMSSLIFKDKIGWRAFVGNGLILLGIAVFATGR